MPTSAPSGESTQRNAAMAKGAGLALLGRAGALIEILSIFLFTQMYGSETYGVFLVLWFIVQALSIVSDFGMTMGLQRFIPQQEEVDETRVGRVLKYAFGISLTVSVLIALALFFSAPWLSQVINANARDSAHLADIIRIYAWAVPLWTMIDLATAAIRAKRVFGPEVKVRIFYEQGFRLVFGSLFFFLGYLSFGLFASHLIGLVATLIFALRLVHKYYGLGNVLRRTGESRTLVREMVFFSTSMILPNLAKKWHSGVPVLVINLMLPGAQGAMYAGIYGVARKIVSVLNIFRESFEYVLAPMASESRRDLDQTQLREMYAFATRLSLGAFIPAMTLIICFREELMRQSGSEFVAGSIAVLILAIGRLLEVMTGPATSIISMMGQYRLPFLNAVGGIILTAGLAVLIVPEWGMAGAAIAAAVGINATSLAAHLEVRFSLGIQPFDRRIIRPLVVAVLLSMPLALVITLGDDWWRTAHFITGFAAFVVTLGLLIRFGYSAEDAKIIVPKPLGRRLPFLLRR